MELMVASLITSVAVGGTFMAIVTASRLSRAQSTSQIGEAMGFAQESVELPRNHVATDDTWFADQAGVWQDDPLPGAATGTESINQPAAGNPAARRYCVIPDDCDGDGSTGDCYRMEVRLCWTGANPANCPAPGGACP